MFRNVDDANRNPGPKERAISVRITLLCEAGAALPEGHAYCSISDDDDDAPSR
jgi:hypothetical protein